MYYVLLFIAYVAAVLAPAPLFFAICLVIALRFRGYACLLVAAIIDVQLIMSVSVIPFYTVSVMAILLVAELVRPRLRLEVSV